MMRVSESVYSSRQPRFASQDISVELLHITTPEYTAPLLFDLKKNVSEESQEYNK